MVLGGLLGSSLSLWEGAKALGEDIVVVPVISLDPSGRSKEARLFSARQEGPRAPGAAAPLPGSSVTAHHQTSVAWEDSALSEVDPRVPCDICCGQDRMPSLVCLAPVQGGLLVSVHVAPLWQTGLGFASAWTPSGCGPEVRPAAAGAPSQTARLPSGATGSRRTGSRCQS